MLSSAACGAGVKNVGAAKVGAIGAANIGDSVATCAAAAPITTELANVRHTCKHGRAACAVMVSGLEMIFGAR